MDEVQGVVLQLRALFSDLRRFDNILFRKKRNAWWVDGMR
jgi:ABC-type transporter Mla maintaining outer membrane lipid asymmetry ATPase subunit MlaF